MDLYPHQHAGVGWLIERKAALLADDMGLGKTITALRASETVGRQRSRVLVVCPAVVLYNWKAEAEKWVAYPEKVRTYGHPSDEGWDYDFVKPNVQVIADGKTRLDPLADIVVVTHGLLLKPYILSQLAGESWDALIVDEAHAFKSPTAKRTMALYGTLASCADRVWLLTGTPCPNHVGELYTHLRALAPERLKHPTEDRVLSHDEWIDRFCLWRWTDYGKKITGNRKDRLPELRERIEGFILRRRKEEVLKDLPPKRLETVHLRPLCLDKTLEALDGKLGPAIREALATGDVDDPEALFSLMKDDEELARWRRLCGVAKAKPVADLVASELEDGYYEKVVVFAWHADVIAEIAESLKKYGARIITGATAAADRQRIVDDFQNDPRVRVVVGNILAAGVGITLTRANEAVFAEQSWVPGDNAQAADRIHRMTQTRECRIRFASLAGTVDELVTASLRQKTKMIEEALGD